MSGEFLADVIRNHLGPAAGANVHAAVLAVVDKCEAMRAEAGIGMHLANEFELLLVRELNAGIPLEHVDEYWRLAGKEA